MGQNWRPFQQFISFRNFFNFYSFCSLVSKMFLCTVILYSSIILKSNLAWFLNGTLYLKLSPGVLCACKFAGTPRINVMLNMSLHLIVWYDSSFISHHI